MNHFYPNYASGYTVDKLLNISQKKQTLWRPYLANMAMFLYGAGWSFAIPLMGQLFVAEAVALATLPFFSPFFVISRFRNLRIILCGYCFLLCGLVVSDLANGTEAINSLRGWANIAFAIINTLFMLSALRVNLRSFHFYLLGMFLAMLVFGSASYAQRQGYVELSIELIFNNLNMFKVRFIPFLIPLLTLVAIYLYRWRTKSAAAIFGISAIVFFMLDARSSGLVLLMAATIFIIRDLPWRFSLAQMATLGIVLAIIGQAVYTGYVIYSQRYNPFGHNASQLSRLKNPYNPFELIFIGRSEWLIAADAISEKPILGHGSWASDSEGTYSYLLAQKTGSVPIYRVKRASRSLIPAHSTLVMAWLWGGFLGLIGILIISNVLFSLGSSVLRMRHGHYYLPAAVLLFCGMLWDLFFSPIQSLRLSFPQGLTLLVILDAIHRFKSRRTFRRIDP